MTKVGAERERYKSDRDTACQKVKALEQQAARVAGAENEKLKKEMADARTEAEAARAEVEKMKEKEKLKAADLKGYMAGINRAAEEYTKVARDIVNDELKLRLPDFYKLGYRAGAVAMVGVMVIEPGTGF